MYDFLMFISVLDVLILFVLVPYFIYLKAKKKQSKIEFLNYKKRVCYILLAILVACSGLISATPEGQKIVKEKTGKSLHSKQEKDKEKKTIMSSKGSSKAGVCSSERSMISADYAHNFICDFIIGKENAHTQLTLEL